MVIPARALNELARILADVDDPVEVVLAGARNQVLFHLDGIDLVSRLIDGQFPNYQQVMPASHATRAILDREELLRAVRPAALIAHESANIVKLQIGADGEPGITVSRQRRGRRPRRPGRGHGRGRRHDDRVQRPLPGRRPDQRDGRPVRARAQRARSRRACSSRSATTTTSTSSCRSGRPPDRAAPEAGPGLSAGSGRPCSRPSACSTFGATPPSTRRSDPARTSCGAPTRPARRASSRRWSCWPGAGRTGRAPTAS